MRLIDADKVIDHLEKVKKKSRGFWFERCENPEN